MLVGSGWVLVGEGEDVLVGMDVLVAFVVGEGAAVFVCELAVDAARPAGVWL